MVNTMIRLKGITFEGQQRQMWAREGQQRLSLLSEESHNDILFGCDPAADHEAAPHDPESATARAEAAQFDRAFAIVQEREVAAVREATEEVNAAAALEANADNVGLGADGL